MLNTNALASIQTPQIEAANFLNLLILDNERTIRDAAIEVAHSLGFSTHVADSAEQAYRLLDSAGIDAVLLELRFPGNGGGLEVLHNIRRQRPDAAVIVTTGYGTVQSAVQAMKSGAYDYVTKPFSMGELRLLFERVSSHLCQKTQILLVTPIEQGHECAAALQKVTGEPVVVAKNLLEATAHLRTENCKVVIFDNHLVEAEPHEADTALAHLGGAVSLDINFALTRRDRLVGEVQAALRRQSCERTTARLAAVATLYSELNNTLTALLVQFDSALEASDLSSEAAEKLRGAQATAGKLRSQLAIAVANPRDQ